MPEIVKYLDIVSSMVELYQKELIKMLRKYPNEFLAQFKSNFVGHFRKLKQSQLAKSIQQNKFSDICQTMNDFLQSMNRVKKTSQSQRYELRSNLQTQEGNRFRFTGMKKQPKMQSLNQSVEMNEIIRSYKIQNDYHPQMRMKWKSFHNNDKVQNQQKQTIGCDNIDLLSSAIPEIQNSIRRLSVPQSKKYDFDMYKTVDTRSHPRKKYIPRLF